ncbi:MULTISPECIES: condensation domain-containing protein [unclassified Pseudoalteromonas]|uniref:condensation domain-containing protein n=1 Tax=unclassified Pseudoalteromonas TaxID=194690 RepID=UPI000409F996|nr:MULTISPECIES: condensation domain-containing protein [unclassified Pseudoalteromonas]PCC14223.1 hypothetical protein CIK86_13775 [Pseudoalteromonas sp. JB197]SJN16296.1 Non-ribosomal peptide synthetase [Pseudoalteromonas sp. JB197]
MSDLTHEARRIVAEAEAQNIVLYVKNNQLAFMAERGKFPDSLKLQIKHHKPAIIDYLLRCQLNAKAKQQTKLIAKAPADMELPLSYAQQGLWFIDQLDAGSSQYNVPVTLELIGELQVTAVESALNRIVQRHEILRTVYKEVDGSPIQQVMPAQPFHLAQYDLSEVPDVEQSKRIQEYAQVELQQPFNLSLDLMLRGCLLRLSEQQHVLFLTMHHIVSDGWSQGVFSYEFTSFYNAFCQGLPDTLPELEIQYSDFAWWQRHEVTQDKLNEQLNFWLEQLADIPLQHSLPLDRPRPVHQQYHGQTYSWQVDNRVLEPLKALAAEYKTTLFVVIHSALSAMLARYSGQQDIVLGSPLAGRSNSQLSPLLGYFINTLVFRSRIDLDMTPRDLLLKNREYAVNAFANQELPFEWLVDALRHQKSLSHSPLFQIMFTLQNNPPSELVLEGLEVAPFSTQNSIVKYDMEWVAEETAAGLQMHCNYSTALFDRSTVMQMAEHLEVMLLSFIEQADDTIWRLPLQGLEQGREAQDHWQHLSYPQAMEAALKCRGIAQNALIVGPIELAQKICILPKNTNTQTIEIKSKAQLLAAIPDYLTPDELLFIESPPSGMTKRDGVTILETQFNEWHRRVLAIKRKAMARATDLNTITGGQRTGARNSETLSKPYSRDQQATLQLCALVSDKLQNSTCKLAISEGSAQPDFKSLQLKMLIALQVLLQIRWPDQPCLLKTGSSPYFSTNETRLLYLDLESSTQLKDVCSSFITQLNNTCYLPHDWMLAHTAHVLQEQGQQVLTMGCYAVDEIAQAETSKEFGLFYRLFQKPKGIDGIELHWRLPASYSTQGNPEKCHEQFQLILTSVLDAPHQTLSDIQCLLQQGTQAKVQKAKRSFKSFKTGLTKEL